MQTVVSAGEKWIEDNFNIFILFKFYNEHLFLFKNKSKGKIKLTEKEKWEQEINNFLPNISFYYLYVHIIF